MEPGNLPLPPTSYLLAGLLVLLVAGAVFSALLHLLKRLTAAVLVVLILALFLGGAGLSQLPAIAQDGQASLPSAEGLVETGVQALKPIGEWGLGLACEAARAFMVAASEPNFDPSPYEAPFCREKNPDHE